MVTRLKPQRVKSSNSPQVGQNLGYEDSNNFKWQNTGAGVGDMKYSDFQWQTLTGNAITIEDISNNITPSSNFTVSAGTVKPGIEYVLRVNTGNTAYTMTLGTGVTNPNGYNTELEPNTVNQFKFIATSATQLELEGVDSAVISEINWGEIGGTLSNQTDLQNSLNAKQDNIVILSYGHSTWQDFIDAYNKNAIVYCKASSQSNPGSGNQTRMAFMAFVNSATPTEVEFQYYRSRSDHNTAANQVDQVFVYKLTSASGGTWTVTERNTAAKAVAGTGIGLTYNASGMTISADTTVLATKTDLNSKQDTLVSGTNIKTINGNSLLGSGNITIDESSFKVFTVTDLDDSSQCYEVYSRVRDGKPAIVIYGSHVFYYTGTYTNLGETKYYFHTLYGYGETIFELILEANAQLYRWDNPTEVNLGGDKIEYVTQAEYNALPSSKLTDNKHYFIYSTSGGGGWQPGVNTIAYYPLESDVKDYSGNNNDGTNNGVTFSNVGGVDCAVFTSASTKIILPGLGSFTNLTMSVWFKTTASYNGSTILMLAPSTNNKNIDLSIEIGTARLSRYTGTSYNITDGIVNDGVWHHMVGTYTSTGGTKLYVDGVFINSDSTTTQVKSDSGYSAIGGHPGGYSWATFDGNISNVIIETAEWSAQDVSNYYDLTKGDYGIS